MTKLIPKWDIWRSEFVRSEQDLLCHLTGFSGSLGILIIHKGSKHLFVDARYTLQAKNECPDIAIHPYETWRQFLKDNTTSVTVDPWLWSAKELEGLPDVQFLSIIDKLWPDRPIPPTYTIQNYTHYTDDTALKIQRICTYLKEKNAKALLITDNESWSWLTNIRSYEKPGSPSVEQFGIVYSNGTYTAYDPLTQDQINGPVIIDETAPVAITQKYPKAIIKKNPIALMKACKSSRELEGFQKAHKQDGLAMQYFLMWLQEESAHLTEMQAEEQLLKFRQQQPDFIQPSFPTISACGPNGAIVHYRSSPKTNRKLKKGDIYLVDSGGQYYGGTTDVTRTILYKGGGAPYEIKENFTLVLKGLIALSTAIFPKDTTGGQLDVLARQFLWKKQRNYAHGTGHGVGACLNVHEGPQSISPKGYKVALQPGMVVSIEPGFYKTGAYGIRIENLAYVEKCDDDWLTFKTLTNVPIDTHLIDRNLLTKPEKIWIDGYNLK